MSAYPASIQNNPVIQYSQKRLWDEHQQLGSWEAVARKYKLNWRYVWEHACTGKVFRNRRVNRKLGIITRIFVRISDMPAEQLKAALEHRAAFIPSTHPRILEIVRWAEEMTA